MRSHPAIQAFNLTKRFSKQPMAHRSVVIGDIARSMLGLAPRSTSRTDEFLAVDDLTFDVAPGEALALIGRNGCGKTTTLRMVAGLITPTSGKATTRGRVQSLIALGTGFDATLTGRENITVGAAAHGFSARETKAIQREVIEFAELDDFIDAPFGTYSSGMKARLGFSLAVHMRPDILLIDEILGVGDFAFQNRCFARMNQLQKRGVTILLVSHAHNRILQMCDRAIWLHKGRAMHVGPSDESVKHYLASLEQHDQQQIPEARRPGDIEPDPRTTASLTADLYGGRLSNHPRVAHAHGTIGNLSAPGLPLTVHCRAKVEAVIELADPVPNLSVNIPIYRKSDGLHLTKLTTQQSSVLEAVPCHCFSLQFEISDLNLADGEYVAFLAVFDGHAFIYRDLLAEFQVLKGDRIYFPNNVLDLSADVRVESVTPQVPPESREVPT